MPRPQRTAEAVTEQLLQDMTSYHMASVESDLFDAPAPEPEVRWYGSSTVSIPVEDADEADEPAQPTLRMREPMVWTQTTSPYRVDYNYIMEHFGGGRSNRNKSTDWYIPKKEGK